MPVTRGGLPPGRTVLPTGWSAPPAAARQASGQPETAVGKKKNHDSPVTGCGFPFPTSPLSGGSRQILRQVRDGRWECASEDGHLLPSVGQGRPGWRAVRWRIMDSRRSQQTSSCRRRICVLESGRRLLELKAVQPHKSVPAGPPSWILQKTP